MVSGHVLSPSHDEQTETEQRKKRSDDDEGGHVVSTRLRQAGGRIAHRVGLGDELQLLPEHGRAR